MWKCVNCNKENHDNRSDCWNCSIPKELASLGVKTALELSTETDNLPAICSVCGTKLDDDARFCQNCASPVVQETIKACYYCGKSINSTSKFCKYCASDLSKKREPIYDSGSDDYQNSSSSHAGREDAERLVFIGRGTAIISGFAFLWGLAIQTILRIRRRPDLEL